MADHRPFESEYLNNFEVVEETIGNTTLYPGTKQLPKLLRALTNEFRTGLPAKIARVDHRATDFMKIQLRTAVNLFCLYRHRARNDRIRLFPVLDANLVARIAVVQQCVTRSDEGRIHRFKFYAGGDFFREIFLNGRRVCFAGHVLERFSQRVPNHIGADLTEFLAMFFGSPVVILLIKDGASAVVGSRESAVFLPIRVDDEINEYFFPTCLTVNQVNDLEIVPPVPAYGFHFSQEYRLPIIRNWNPLDTASDYYHKWKNKTPLADPTESATVDRMSWASVAHSIEDGLRNRGYDESAKIKFVDNIHGPNVLYIPGGQTEMRFSEIEHLKQHHPTQDWQKIISERMANNPEWFRNVVA
jgi:hypothetical protein